MSYYVVSVGERPGIYTDPSKFMAAIGNKKQGASFGKFDTEAEAKLAYTVGCSEYRAFCKVLSEAGELPDKLYVIAYPKKNAGIFTDKREYENTVEYLQNRGVSVKSMAFGAPQLVDALLFWSKGITPGADNLSLKQYEYVQEIFTRSPLFTKQMEKRYDAVNEAGLASFPGKRLQLHKYPQPRRMKGNDHDLKEDSFDSKASRDDIRAFLVAVTGRDKTKFDTVNDAFIGNYTERFLQDFLLAKYAITDISVFRYGDLFDEDKILAIMDKYTTQNADGTRSVKPGVQIKEEDVKYVDSFFFDQYDIMLSHNNHQALLDIKAAGTARAPSPSWDFLYPEKQVQRYLHAAEKHEAAKEYIVAAFCKTDTSAPKDMNTAHDVQLWGILDMDTIAKAPKIKKGAYTPHGTYSRDDNRMLTLSQFSKLTDFVEGFILESEDAKHREAIKQGLYKGMSFQDAYKQAHAGEGINSLANRVRTAQIGRKQIETMVRERVNEMMPELLYLVNESKSEMQGNQPRGLDTLIGEASAENYNHQGVTEHCWDDDAR